MPIDIDKLLRFPIPKCRQEVTARDMAFYALCTGMGHDPLDAAELDYVDANKGPKVIPSMVLVTAHPGFWMIDPESGVDPEAVLHANQSFEILAPMPGPGPVDSETRLTKVIDKGPGKAALVQTQTDLYSHGTLYSRQERTLYIRDGGGFGGEDAPHAPHVPAPTTPPDVVIDLETRPEQALFYRLNGDMNPLHADPVVAGHAGFPRPILHGLGTAAVVTRALLKGLVNYDPARLKGWHLRFSHVVFPGDTVRTEIWSDGRFRASVPARDSIVIDDGQATVVPA